MFQHFKTLSVTLIAAFTLSACADLAYLFDFNKNKNNDKVASTPQTDASVKPANYLPQRDEQPINTVHSQYDVYHAAQCLVQHIASDFNLPENFYAAQGYDDGAATVLLVNPATGKSGLYIDIVPMNNGSQLLLYPNRATISNAWKRLPEKCR